MTRKRNILAAVTVLVGAMLASAANADSPHLTVQIGGLDQHGRLSDSAVFCSPTSGEAGNISPEVTWSSGPAGTQSYALLMVDPDVPEDFSQINKPDTTIPVDAPRISVHHWVLVDIPETITTLPLGIESDGLVPRGKPIGVTDHGLRGANVYTTFLATDENMAGTYGGYDGPCPPINDDRIHRYVVHVFALDVPTLGLSGAFDGAAVEDAVRGHILAQGEAVAAYTLNPDLIGKPVQ